MRPTLLLLIVYVTAVLETSLADAVRVGHVAPDLLALLAVVYVLSTPGRRAFLVAGAIGLAADLVSPGRPGLGVACFLLVGYALTRLRTKFPLDLLAGQVLAVGLGTTLLSTGLATGAWLFGEATVSLPTLLVRAFGVGLYTAGVSLPLWMILGWTREPRRAPRGKPTPF
ncbi:MAG: rod shape-determining protein MreD [Planctomycetota bacterium]